MYPFPKMYPLSLFQRYEQSDFFKKENICFFRLIWKKVKIKESHETE